MNTTPYSPRALDLVRFQADPADDANAAVVRAAIATDGGRTELRRRLTESDAYNLIAFAKRRAAEGLREDDLALALEAVDALTLVARARIDYRDLNVDFPLFAARELGADAPGLALRAAADSEPGTATAFGAAAARVGGLTLRDCAYLEVSTRYGLGFMDTWASSYDPRGDLARQVVEIADEIDRQGRYIADAPHCADLPSVWFGHRTRRAAPTATTGCVSVTAGLAGGPRWGNSLLVFLAEVRSRSEAEPLARAANNTSIDGRPQVALAEGDTLLLIVGGSFTRGDRPIETRETLLQLANDIWRSRPQR